MMTDAHDPRLKAERDAVLRSLSGLARENASTALDALIEKALALGAADEHDLTCDRHKFNPPLPLSQCLRYEALAATGKEVT